MQKPGRVRVGMGSNKDGERGRLEAQQLASPISVLTEMDVWSASTRYRALQYVPYLQRHFRSVHVSVANDIVIRRPGRLGQGWYFATHGLRYLRRGLTLHSAVAERTALLVQRGLYPLGPGAIATAVLRFPGRVVFDLDDAVFRTSPKIAEKGALGRWLYGPQQALLLLHRADAVVVSTPTLAELLPDGCAEPVVIPTVPDPTLYAIRKHDEELPVVVGWTGTVGGLSYLDPLKPVFEKLSAKGLAELEVVSSSAWSGPARFHRWQLLEETSLFQRFDIGIMPLPRTDYTRAKAGFKLLQYMAAGLPVVASPVGINAELVVRSGGGLLADSPAEWEEALQTLAGDASLRERFGRSGRAFIEAYAGIEDKAATLAGLLDGPNARDSRLPHPA